MKQLTNALSAYFNPDHKETAMNTTNQQAAHLAADSTKARALPAGITRKTTGYNADPRRICRKEGWNTRFDFGDIANLAESIATELARDPSNGGLLHDLRVKRLDKSDPRSSTHDFEIVDGDRRLTAIELLLERGVAFPEGVGIKLVERTQDDLTSLIQMYTANTGKPFLPLEEAAAFKRMRDAGMTILAIAKAVGKADTHVIETLALLEADEDLQDAVKKGTVGATMAKVIATTARGDKAAQKELTEEAKKAKGKGADAKAAKARLLKKLEDKKAAKAAAKGKTLKMKSMTDDALSELGAKMAKALEAKVKEAGWKKFETLEDMVEMVAKDEKLVAAFTLGTVLALRAAAGIKVELDI